MKKKNVATIKQYDYKSWEDFQKDIPKMQEKGYWLIEEGRFGFSEQFAPRKIDDENYEYKVTAYFIKSDMI